MTSHLLPSTSASLFRVSAAAAFATVLAAFGCNADETGVPAACVDLLECCSDLADTQACERSYDAALEVDDREAAAASCAAAVSGAQDLGLCGGDGTDSGPLDSSGPDSSDPPNSTAQ